MPLSYLELSADNAVRNVASLRGLLRSGTKVAVAVKGNAYGHGLVEMTAILEPHVDFFQVDDIEELRRLRAVSRKPTLVLGYVEPEAVEEAVTLDGSLAVYDAGRLAVIAEAGERLGKRPNVHLMVDALLGREGILPADLDAFLDALAGYPSIRLEGVYAHFANIEDTSDFTHPRKQIDAYHRALHRIQERGFNGFFTHISSTAGSLAYESERAEQDMVRIGIGAYGLWPSEELRERFGGRLELKPVMRWVSRVIQVKELPAGHPVGYGLTFVTDRPTRVAIIPQGYSDGYDRGLSNNGEVLVRGCRCPVVGRVSMNMLTVDVSAVTGVAAGDEAVLLGSQGNETVSAEELAAKIGTINYEVVARVSPLLERRVA